jgi:hypothetical protein
VVEMSRVEVEVEDGVVKFTRAQAHCVHEPIACTSPLRAQADEARYRVRARNNRICANIAEYQNTQ